MLSEVHVLLPAELADDPILALEETGGVHRVGRGGHALEGVATGSGEDLGRGEQVLRGDASCVHAGPADRPPLNEGHACPET